MEDAAKRQQDVVEELNEQHKMQNEALQASHSQEVQTLKDIHQQRTTAAAERAAQERRGGSGAASRLCCCC